MSVTLRAASPRRVRPLRTKLTLALVTLLAVVCLIVSVVGEFTLKQLLTRQIDGQLADTVHRSQQSNQVNGGNHGDEIGAAGNQEGTLYARLQDGQVVHAQTLAMPPGGGQVRPRNLDPGDIPALRTVAVDGQGHNLALSEGAYRVVAVKSGDGVDVFGLPNVDETLVTLGFLLSGIAAAALVGAAIVGAYVVRRTLRPLDRVAAAAAKVTELPLDRGEAALPVRVPVTDTDPATEIGQVGSALNRMLGHIDNALDARHGSEMRVRRFVADAGHELRTPLAAIRGYAELTRRSGDRVPPGIAHAMSRVESEASRMTVLVNDLLLLARLDEGRPLERAEVDFTRLVADAVGDAHVSGPGHRWRLDLPDHPVIVTGDAQRLHQVLVNLLANGRTHTPPGTTVSTRLAVSPDGSAVLTVTDSGPGIPPEVLPHVFERFARGDLSRSRAQGDTGLGMAIVAAVVAAHHGTVGVRSSPGRTEFEVRFPHTAVEQRIHDNGQDLPATVKL